MHASLHRKFALFALAFAVTRLGNGAEVFIDPTFDVQVQEDVVFGAGDVGNPVSGEIPLAMDVFSPAEADFMKPAILLLYGGGFEERHLDQLRPLAEEFASRGWLAATGDYRILPDEPTAEPGPFGDPEDAFTRAMHAAFNDAAKGLAWLRENSTQLGIDPERIVMGGASSGAITSLFEGYRNNSVDAIVSFCGGMYGFDGLIDAGDPPVVLVHDEIDELVAFDLAQDVVARANGVGVPNSLLKYEGEGHCDFLLDATEAAETIAFVNQFLYDQLELASIGDFNGNGVRDVDDIDQLTRQAATKNHDSGFDINGDSLVDVLDIQAWVGDLENTWVGDSNLDGEFNSTDFISAFQAGKFETAEMSVWSEGDWTGDGVFESGDLVAAFQDGGFELGPRSAGQSVPEPMSLLMLAVSVIMLASTERQRRLRSLSR